jgi:MOSC domain-containing protein YiiM
MNAQVIGISLRPGEKRPLEEVSNAMVDEIRGLLGDFRSANTKKRERQLTILFRGGWEAACAQLRVDLPWTTRRANLYIEGLCPSPDMVGMYLCIGPNLVLKITGETKPCIRMDEAHPGLKEVLDLDWRAGITCEVVRGGGVVLGDPVELKAA